MSKTDLKKAFADAAEIAASVPKELRETAFNRALDALLGDSKKSRKSGTTKAGGSRRSTTGGSASEDSSNTVAEQLGGLDRTKHSEVSGAPRVLERALFVLRAARDDLEIDGLTSPQIAHVLTDKYRLRATRQAVTQALDAAGDKVDRNRVSGAVTYRLMQPGDDYLTEADFPARATNRKSSSKKKAPKKRAARKDSKTKKTKASGKNESYQLDRDLDLRGDKSIPSFREFHKEKSPRGAKEFNAVAIYYLKKLVGLKSVTLNQAYTCYREASVRPPEAFRQSFLDTKNKNGWIEFDSEGNLEIPHRGSVFVEHDLPKPAKSKKK